MKPSLLSIAVTSALFAPGAVAQTENDSTDLPSMLVSADFRPAEAQDIPVSLTTFDEEIIESRGAQHIEDVLNLAPNVNLSSGASRGQYFQIRGIGERSQFAAPLNPSVGLIIDGIDFSRTGGAATLFDIEQVEVLRGPQGTRYGTNALAGVINMQSKQATNELDMDFESTVGNYNTRSVGVAVGGPLIKDTLLGRVAVHTYQSDGFMDNDFLGRDNTQNRDEITARSHLKWLVNNDLTIDLNLLHLNIDNGYDAFTFDNSRNSLADQPGEDKQHTNAFALKSNWQVNQAVAMESALTYSKSDITYSYDADWMNNPTFNASESFYRNRENYSFETRLLSDESGRIFNGTTDWVIGAYFLSQDEDLDLISDFGNLQNDYQTYNTALFGQLDTALTDRLTLISGLRVERFEADYEDSNGLDLAPSETLFGGKLGLNYQLSNNHMMFTSLSRGYKSGGVNNNDNLPDSKREFDTEYMWNLEVGLKSLWLEGDLITNITAFYALRRDAQVKSSISLPGGEFEDSIDNAARGKNIGIEADMDWLINDQFRVFAALGLLSATFDEYENPELEAEGFNVEGRRQAHAPAYQFTLGSEVYLNPNWTFRANIEGKDEFYFSNSHDSKSGSYVITNASLQYQKQSWKFTLWGRNLFDKDYYTRGFFFDNTPPNYVGNENTYKQYGDPRTFGMTVSYDY
ncbi:MAG: TonB-dependent receptor [Methylophaga sp.]|uniref:TonB-dependent receptor n=1 Tax=Methylophaga sp. TaxID=2024840 RepID=UPI000C0DC203|nr:TonB-dependent receptor [Methylophaga sp.]MBL1458077.1 TonB-dependent receptor [Methylophaga sp.]